MLGNKVLNFVTETKCLGLVIIDNQLSWHSQVELICKTYGQKVNQLKRLKYLTKDTLQSIFFTSIIPAVTYCNLVWGTCSPSLLNEVEHIHARAATIIHRPPDASDQEALTLARWEPINAMYKRKVLMVMYKVHISELPDDIIKLYDSTSSHGYDLRKSIKLAVLRFDLDARRTSLRYRGPLSWNFIPDTLEQAQNLNIVKALLKKRKSLLNNIDFRKEACIISKKNPQYEYF